jgi:mono/diheme cytochrome c family protein/plastocyanin
MARREIIALLLLGLIVVGTPLATLGYQYWLRPGLASTRIVEIAMRVPQDGGFKPGAITIETGQPVTLRFVAYDVTHGVAIGPGLGVDLGHIDPGQIREITLTFDQPGTYTYYCNAWCSPDHWRMRGTIQVIDPARPAYVPPVSPDPVIEALIAEGVDLDASHGDEHRPDEATATPFERPPSAQRGAQVLRQVTLPEVVRDPLWQRSHTPAQALELLTVANPQASATDLDDVVAYLWTTLTLSELAPDAQMLYNKNCAACHGQFGGGDGPAADTTAQKPVAFADPAYMVEMRSDVLYAQIRRGGMGTDMPNFGTVFTPEETWALVQYLWSLAFQG